MEYDDSQVLDWQFKRFVELRCYGSKEITGFGTGQSGTSAYMLFYERVKKKDIRLVITPETNQKFPNRKEFETYLDEKMKAELALVKAERDKRN